MDSWWVWMHWWIRNTTVAKSSTLLHTLSVCWQRERSIVVSYCQTARAVMARGVCALSGSWLLNEECVLSVWAPHGGCLSPRLLGQWGPEGVPGLAVIQHQPGHDHFLLSQQDGGELSLTRSPWQHKGDRWLVEPSSPAAHCILFLGLLEWLWSPCYFFPQWLVLLLLL